MALYDFVLPSPGAIMSSLSVRGLDDRALLELKRRAAREDASVNTLVVQLIEQGLGSAARQDDSASP